MSVPRDSLMGMEFWDEIVGQPAAVGVLERAAAPEVIPAHAWLITGPPGSGRSNLALRFAAALIAREPAARDHVYAQVVARTHPDVAVLSTERVIIPIEDVRKLIPTAYYSPSEGRFRVIVIEDADRMSEHASNVLLKALEEPPERTVWVLCAPSEADLLPTIRSRARSLRLVTPQPEQVAQMLQARDGIPFEVAERAARLAQSHIGMARRLATDAEALARRTRTIELALGASTLGEGMGAAAALLKVADADAKALTEALDERERESALRNLGVAPGAAIPPQLRAQVRSLEEDQKRRATRGLRDGIDRILTDLLSLYRDVLLHSMGAGGDLINAEHAEDIADVAERWSVARGLGVISSIEQARDRLSRGVTPGLVLEALFARIAVDTEASR